MRTFALEIPRDGAVVARWAHNPKVVSSSLAPATKPRGCNQFATSFILQQLISTLHIVKTSGRNTVDG